MYNFRAIWCLSFLSLSLLITPILPLNNAIAEDMTGTISGLSSLEPIPLSNNIDDNIERHSLRRDDPGDDWIIYDDDNPSYYIRSVNVWNRVRFEPQEEFTLWGANIMAYNPNGIEAPMQVFVFSEDEDGNLDEELWSREIDEVPSLEWVWVEITQRLRPTFDAEENFSIVFGPAPGGDIQNDEDAGWSGVYDSGSNVDRTYIFIAQDPDDDPPADFDDWSGYDNDCMMRANGQYQADYVDLSVKAVYNHEEEESRNWTIADGQEVTFYATVLNQGMDVEAAEVNFRMVDSEGNSAFDETVDIEDFGADDNLVVESPAWQVADPYGMYQLWVEVTAEDDVDDENNKLGLDQIVIHHQESEDTWLGYTNGDQGGNWYFPDGEGFNENAGYGVVFYHPGGPYPLWVTDLRARTVKDIQDDVEIEFSLYKMDTEDNELSLKWEGTGSPEYLNVSWVEMSLDEDEYIRFDAGEAVMGFWRQAANTYMRRGGEAPHAAANRNMPFAMLQTTDGQNWSIVQNFDAAIQVKIVGPEGWSGLVTGTVTELENGHAIRNALVRTSGGSETTTNNSGKYEIYNWEEGSFNLTVSKDGFADSILTDISVDPGDTLVADFALVSPAMEFSVEELVAECPPDSMVTKDLSVYSTGNGNLYWELRREWADEAKYEPWEERGHIDVSDIIENYRLNSVAYVNGYYIVGATAQDTNRFYVFDNDEELQYSFAQPGDAASGIPDLASDGINLWGSGENDIFEFDIEGNQIDIIEGPINPVKGIAYDSFNDWLWVCGSRTDLFALDMAGEVMKRIEPPNLRLGSLFFCPEDPDGYYLYATVEITGEDVQSIYKFNTTTGAASFVRALETDSYLGTFATKSFDIYDWVLLSMEDIPQDDGGDVVHITELYPNVSWVQSDTLSGIITPGGSQDIVLTFNALGLPRDQYNANLLFYHNGVGSPKVLPVEFNVFGGPRPPSNFDLLTPVNEDTIGIEGIEFTWRQSIDPNPTDVVSYNHWLKAGEDSIMTQSDVPALAIDLSETGIEYEYGTKFRWWVEAVSGNDTLECNNRFVFYYMPNSANLPPLDLPTEFAITGVYPNPFNSTFELNYSLNKTVAPMIEIYDFNGRLMASIISERKSVGYHKLAVDASKWPSGIYMARIIAGNEIRTAKVVTIK